MTFTPDIEITADEKQEQAKINEALAIAGFWEAQGLSFEDSKAVVKFKLELELAEIKRKLALLELV